MYFFRFDNVLLELSFGEEIVAELPQNEISPTGSILYILDKGWFLNFSSCLPHFFIEIILQLPYLFLILCNKLVFHFHPLYVLFFEFLNFMFHHFWNHWKHLFSIICFILSLQFDLSSYLPCNYEKFLFWCTNQILHLLLMGNYFILYLVNRFNVSFEFFGSSFEKINFIINKWFELIIIPALFKLIII